MDRISELPQPLLQHILCFLSQKEAVQTCVLSKSWRYLGSTRPNLELLYDDYNNEQTFLSILDKTIRRYHEQKLCIQDFHAEFFTKDPESVSFLERWFPNLVESMGGVKTFDLSFHLRKLKSPHFDLPLAVFENSNSLRNLRLCGFRFSPNLPMDRVHLEHLQTLILKNVHIVDETFQNIMSSCPFIERLDLSRCKGLTTIRLMNKNRLKRVLLYGFQNDHEYIKTEDLCFVDVPNLESLEFSSCDNYWFNIDRHRNMYFPGLKSLELKSLRLAMRPSLDILSRDFPSLQDIKIHDCTGFGELRVSNRSVRNLTLTCLYSPMKVVVDTPNLAQLNYKYCSSTLDFYFATTSDECEAKMEPCCDVHSEDGFLKLRKLLEIVIQSSSKIHLVIPHKGIYSDWSDCGTTSDEDDYNGGHGYDDYYCDECDNNGGVGYCYDDYYGDEGDNNGDDNHEICAGGDGGYNIEPVPLEYLLLDYVGHGFFYSKEFLNRMFRYCRPRNILERHCSDRSLFLCKKLVLKQNRESPCDWQRDLEEASMELWDKNSEEWHSVDGTTFLESGGAEDSETAYHYFKHHEVWFKLKWRDQQIEIIYDSDQENTS